MTAVQLTFEEAAESISTFDFHRSARVLARATDAATSRAAAKGIRSGNRIRVLQAFARCRDGLDYISAANESGLESHEAERRIADLRHLGYLSIKLNDDGSEATVTLPSGRKGRLHIITTDGIAALSN